ncbi:MAG TPA: cyclic 2,3-diphosphoglycerate synthase [bacterium]|nr:cyclic 2,3-diphosphoglycerate synthase [bacterium]
MVKKNVVIMGAAGRDFHNFNLCFKDNQAYHVVAFTATQIPNIEGRRYPPELAGDLYAEGIPIMPESDLEYIIRKEKVSEVVFSYSDVSHEYVMHTASRVSRAGADFRLPGTTNTMLQSSKPVVAVCAVRTGAGKSQTTRRVAGLLADAGKKVVVIRHPMPYGNLVNQRVQRFASIEDLQQQDCTIEEMEEYEPHINRGSVVYAGVDYEAILARATDEAEIILWDGGNNDTPFITPDILITVTDPHRPGHEIRYYPGETNLRMADAIVINKIDTAEQAGIAEVRANISTYNPDAMIIEAASPLQVDNPSAIRGKAALAVEDGPTLTHGNMEYGAAVIAARKFGASNLVDPRPYLTGSLQKIFAQYPNIGALLPAIGYGTRQIKDLEATINRTECDVVVIGTPIDLRRVVTIRHPTVRVSYDLQEIGQPTLRDILQPVIS